MESNLDLCDVLEASVRRALAAVQDVQAGPMDDARVRGNFNSEMGDGFVSGALHHSMSRPAGFGGVLFTFWTVVAFCREVR